MAKTLLEAVNEVFKRVGIVHGDSDQVARLTNSSRQRSIDVAIQVINEGIDEVFNIADKPVPNFMAEDTITLVTDTRAYTLASDLVRLHWPLIDKTNNQYIIEYPGGYDRILIDDPGQEWTGVPYYAAVNPVNSQLYMDRSPTSEENGNVYTYQYEKDTVLSVASDQMPFADLIYRAFVPVWAQLWRREIQNDFDLAQYNLSLGRACSLLKRVPNRKHRSPRSPVRV